MTEPLLEQRISNTLAGRKEEKTLHTLKTPISRGGWGLVARQRACQAGCVYTNRRRPPSLTSVSVFSFDIIFIPVPAAPAGVDRKGSETQVAQTCVIALRLWQKFPLAK